MTSPAGIGQQGAGNPLSRSLRDGPPPKGFFEVNPVAGCAPRTGHRLTRPKIVVTGCWSRASPSALFARNYSTPPCPSCAEEGCQQQGAAWFWHGGRDCRER